MSRRALLVTMPWLTPDVAPLAPATLGQILEAGGHPVDLLYGTVLFPRTPTRGWHLELHGGFLFAPWLYPGTDVDALVETIIDERLEATTLWGVLSDDREAMGRAAGLSREHMRAAIRADIARAGVCLDRCFERAAGHDLVGFSLTFETQLPASLALARRLKERDPAVKVVFGGAACVEEQAEGIVASFDVVDAVCHTEGEDVIVPLFDALAAGAPLAGVPGIAYRDAGGAVRKNPGPPLIEDLDRTPFPRHDAFLEQYAASEWGDRKRPALLFETSRGCWWGQKHLCTFCGLNAEGLAFRSKSPERAYDEIAALYRDHPQARLLQATDNILELRYFSTLLPRLARMPRDPGRPLRIFYEVKSNMRAGQVALLAAAGISMVQPGIEAFDDQILKLMDKGCTGLGQIQFIKWAYQERVLPVYNLIVRNPGEEVEAYRRMLELIPFIRHLPPPGGVTPMLLMRFSPYFERSADFGIEARRPFDYYRRLYPDPAVDLERIAYQFEYEHPARRDPALRAVVREFCLRIMQDWQKDWQPHRAFWVDAGDHVVIHDRRSGIEVTDRLDGLEASLFRFLDAARPFALIERHLAGALSAEALRALLDRWHERRWLCRSPDDVHLSVLPLERPRPQSVDEVIAGAAAARAPRAELRVVT